MGCDCCVTNDYGMVIELSRMPNIMLTGSLRCFVLMAVSSFVAAEIQVLDDTGQQVILAGPAERIVSLAPHLTELLFSIGVGSKIVGTVRFSDYPEAAKQIPVMGDAFAVNIESIVAREPDLVVAWHTGGTNKAIEKLRSLGVPVYVNEAGDLESIAKSTQTLAVLVGEDTRGRDLKRTFLTRLESLRKENSGSAKRVFFQISDQSLFTVNDAHLIGQALSVCGAENIYGASGIPVPIVSKESVLDAAPDLIVISQPTGSAQSPWINTWSEVEGYAAKIRLINPALISRPSLRMVEGISELCRLVSGGGTG